MYIKSAAAGNFCGLYIASEQRDNIYSRIEKSKYKDGILELLDELKHNENSHIRVMEDGDVFLSSYGKGGHFDFYTDTYENFIAAIKMIYCRFGGSRDKIGF